MISGGNWQPWQPTATSAGPSSPPTADTAECEAEPGLLALFQHPELFLFLINWAPTDCFCRVWICMGFIFPTFFKWKLITDQKILRMTSLDTMSALMPKDILNLEKVVPRDRNCWHLFVFFLASLEIQSAYDNHRLLILSTGRDKNFSQRSWELTSLLRMSSWCHTQQISPKRQFWSFCSRYKETEMVMEFVYLAALTRS